MVQGNVALVLNAHFPYVRRAGRWPHGEESLHRVMAESYLPLLTMVSDLRAAHDRALPISLSISPILLEQLTDPVIAKHFLVWLGEWRERATADLRAYEREGDGHGSYLARFYIDWSETIEHAFVNRFGRNLGATLRSLMRDTSEVLLAPATFAYLPHLSPAEMQAQLDVGALTVIRQLGIRPNGLWLPSGGYSGDDSGALIATASELGLKYAIGGPAEHTQVGRLGPRLSIVHADHTLSQHVTAPEIGYPGDGLYREFHREHPASGIAYWRVTGADVPIDQKQRYDPYLAFSRAEEHAAHFVRAIRTRLAALSSVGLPTTIVLAFDAELFGHWWFEGVRWLQTLVQHLISADDLNLVTISQALPMLPAAESDEPLSHPLFDSPVVAPLHRRLREAGERFAAAVRRLPSAEGLEELLLAQAARELLLAQSSDWAALIATGAAEDYAQRRFDEHLARLDRLLYYLSRDEPTPDAASYLHEISEVDNPFLFVNYRMWG